MVPALSASLNPPPPLSDAGIQQNHSRLLLRLLKQCTDMTQLKQIHAQALRSLSPLHPSTFVVYSQILQFSSSTDLDYAYRVFDQIENPNSFTWNTLIRACASKIDSKDQAIKLYRKMLEEGIVTPDKHTFPFVLKGCAYLFSLCEGKQVHGQALKLGFGFDVYVNNSLIHFYGSCGCLDLAQKVFDEMAERSLVSWNVLIEAVVQFGEFDRALNLFNEMQNSFDPDRYTMHSVISACAGLGSLALGVWAHAYLLKKVDLDAATEVLLKSSLVDMYCKCGSLELAQQVFERMRKRNVTSWNYMILGFAMHGKAEAALQCFERMVRTETFPPNSITFVGILSACKHRGMVAEGRKYFEMMVEEYRIDPVLEHYGCLVDLLARAGLIDEALDIISKMPMKPDVVIWRSLLDACSKTNASVQLSEEVARQILESEDDVGSGVYVLLSKIYAAASRWDEVGLVRKLMTDRGIAKEPGCSSIEIDGVTHELFAGDTSHPQTKEIYQMLDTIDQKLDSFGYSPDHSQAHSVDEHDLKSRERCLRLHSERLAISLGLLRLPPGMPIRVFKNLRVCNDCHERAQRLRRHQIGVLPIDDDGTTTTCISELLGGSCNRRG